MGALISTLLYLNLVSFQSACDMATRQGLDSLHIYSRTYQISQTLVPGIELVGDLRGVRGPIMVWAGDKKGPMIMLYKLEHFPRGFTFDAGTMGDEGIVIYAPNEDKAFDHHTLSGPNYFRGVKKLFDTK